MTDIYGADINHITLGVVIAVAVVLGVVVAFALRRPLVVKMGLRNIPRRRAQTLLIIFGLTLATIIVTMAFSTGDTLSISIRDDSLETTGRIDLGINYNEVAFDLAPDEERDIPDQLIRDLDAAFADDERVDAVFGVRMESAGVRNVDTRLSEPSFMFVGLDPAQVDSFGAIPGLDGEPYPLSSLASDEILLNADTAANLDAEVGHRLSVVIGSRTQELRVAAIVDTTLLTGWGSSIIFNIEAGGVAPIATVRDIFQADAPPGEWTFAGVAAGGSVLDGLEFGEALEQEINAQLVVWANQERDAYQSDASIDTIYHDPVSRGAALDGGSLEGGCAGGRGARRRDSSLAVPLHGIVLRRRRRTADLPHLRHAGRRAARRNGHVARHRDAARSSDSDVHVGRDGLQPGRRCGRCRDWAAALLRHDPVPQPGDGSLRLRVLLEHHLARSRDCGRDRDCHHLPHRHDLLLPRQRAQYRGRDSRPAVQLGVRRPLLLGAWHLHHGARALPAADRAHHVPARAAPESDHGSVRRDQRGAPALDRGAGLAADALAFGVVADHAAGRADPAAAGRRRRELSVLRPWRLDRAARRRDAVGPLPPARAAALLRRFRLRPLLLVHSHQLARRCLGPRVRRRPGTVRRQRRHADRVCHPAVVLQPQRRLVAAPNPDGPLRSSRPRAQGRRRLSRRPPVTAPA